MDVIAWRARSTSSVQQRSGRRRRGDDTRSVTSMASGASWSSRGFPSASSPSTPRSKRPPGCCGTASSRRRRSSSRSGPSWRPRAGCRRRRSACCATVRAGESRSDGRACASRPGRSRSGRDDPAAIVACIPTIVAAYWRLQRGMEPIAPRRRSGSCREFPLHADGRGAGSRDASAASRRT